MVFMKMKRTHMFSTFASLLGCFLQKIVWQKRCRKLSGIKWITFMVWISNHQFSHKPTTKKLQHGFWLAMVCGIISHFDGSHYLAGQWCNGACPCGCRSFNQYQAYKHSSKRDGPHTSRILLPFNSTTVRITINFCKWASPVAACTINSDRFGKRWTERVRDQDKYKYRTG